MIRISITRFLVILTGVAVVALLILVGISCVGICDSECPWISSFIEISIGLDGALVINRLRRWQRRSLLVFCNGLLETSLERQVGNMGEEGAALFAEITTRIFKRFEYRFSVIGKYAAVCGPLFAIGGVFLLLAGCDCRYYWLLVLLVSPFAVFYASSYVCYLCARDHFYEISYDLGADQEKELGSERENFISLEKLKDKILKGKPNANGK